MKFRIHFYLYLQCQRCQHIFNGFDEIKIAEQRRRYLMRMEKVNREFVQNSPTQSFFERRKNENKERSVIVKKYANAGNRILEADAIDGSLDSHLEIYDYTGLTTHKRFREDWNSKLVYGSMKNVSSDNRFDVVFFFDYLEHCYCPFMEVVRAMKIGNKTVATIPINRNPKQTYRASCHEFSSQSVRKFAAKLSKKNTVIDRAYEAIVILEP